jgi:hypothetical protein
MVNQDGYLLHKNPAKLQTFELMRSLHPANRGVEDVVHEVLVEHGVARRHRVGF